MEAVLHARRTDPRVGDWLAAVSPSDPVAEAQVREIRRAYDRAVKVPARLAGGLQPPDRDGARGRCADRAGRTRRRTARRRAPRRMS